MTQPLEILDAQPVDLSESSGQGPTPTKCPLPATRVLCGTYTHRHTETVNPFTLLLLLLLITVIVCEHTCIHTRAVYVSVSAPAHVWTEDSSVESVVSFHLSLGSGHQTHVIILEGQQRPLSRNHLSHGLSLCPLCSRLPHPLSAFPCQGILSLVFLSHPIPRPHMFPGDNCPLGCSASLDLKGSFLWGQSYCQKVLKPGLRLGTRAGSSFLHQALSNGKISSARIKIPDTGLEVNQKVNLCADYLP